jgi:mannose-6-phosphate isomerase-like protein (cupin superfamily)
MRRMTATLALLTLPLLSAAAPPPGAIQWPIEKIVYVPAAATLPPGTQIAALEGDIKVAAMFTIRLKLPAGSTLAPHWHPRDERVTVLSGEAQVGFGETADPATMTSFGPGSFYVNPAGRYHYVVFPKETVIQLTCMGPWEVNYAK